MKLSACSLSSRERVERIINFEAPDRVAFNFWMDRRRMTELDEKFGSNFRINHYDADVIESLLPIYYPSGKWEAANGTAWLVEPAFEDYETALRFTMPDPTDPRTYAGLQQDLNTYKDKAVIANLANVLGVMEGMRPQATLYMDMMMYPEQLKILLNRLSDVMAAVAERVCQMDITALYVQDDVAFNGGLLMSMEMFREFVLPHWKKPIEVAHAYGKPVFFHTDGKCDSIWDVFAEELGIRMLNPLQPNLQDVAEFKCRYHGRMGIYGGLETGILHMLTPAQIRRHVFELFEKTGKDGGLIISSHDIDYSITDEQLNALVAAIKDCRYA